MLKIYKLLLVEGMNNADAGLIYPTLPSKQRRYDRFITTFEKEVNGKILGTEEIGNSATWRIPYEEKHGEKVVGDVSLNNMKMRKMMEKIDPLLIDIDVVEGRRTEWKTAMVHISKAFQIARKHGEYTDAEIVQFQIEVDQFYVPWLSVIFAWIKCFIQLYPSHIK